MILQENYSLLTHNTFRLDVRARWFAEYESVEQLRELLLSDLLKNQPFYHIGSGSNLLFIKDYDGIILHSGIKGYSVISEDEETVRIRVGAGVPWDDFVSYCGEKGWGGTENLSLIPGEVGASAVQNIGAYGAEVKDIIDEVETVDIAGGRERVFSLEECRYGYRQSIFKRELKGQYIVTAVVYKLKKNPVFNLNYGNLKDALNAYPAIDLKNIRDAVIAIRNEKLPDPEKIGNAGSFFMNPVIPISHYENLKKEFPQMPHYIVDDVSVKVPAGWLIDQCGWRGKEHGGAAVHDKQCLVLVNKKGATAREVVELSQLIQKSVREKFDISIFPEVNFI